MSDHANSQVDNISTHQNRRTRQLTSTQVMFAVVLAVGMMLAIQFSARITDERDLQRMNETVLLEIDLLQREQVELVEQLAFVESDAYVEDWARAEGKMIRGGEVLVVPVPSATILDTLADEAPEIAQAASIEATFPEPEKWELWWSLFFDSPPPQLTS